MQKGKKRGRVSAAALEISVNPLERVDRVRPPHDLTDEEVEVWVAVVNDHAADWFSPSTVPLLTAYCRHVINGRRIAELIEKATGDPELSVQSFNKLLQMQQRESLTMATLAMRMRIAQQATLNHRGNKAGIAAPKLNTWD